MQNGGNFRLIYWGHGPKVRARTLMLETIHPAQVLTTRESEALAEPLALLLRLAVAGLPPAAKRLARVILQAPPVPRLRVRRLGDMPWEVGEPKWGN